MTVQSGTFGLSGPLTCTGVSSAISVSGGTVRVSDLAGTDSNAAFNWTHGNVFINGTYQLPGTTLTIPGDSIFGGNGTINSAMTVSNSGTLSPGDGGPGVLKLTPATGGGTFSNSSNFAVQIDGTTAGSLNSNYSQLVYAATGSSSIPTLRLGGNLVLSLGYGAGDGDSYTIIHDATGTQSISGTFAGLADGGTFNTSAFGQTYTFGITYHGNGGDDVVVTELAHTPEPAIALPLLGFTGLALRRRCRR